MNSYIEPPIYEIRIVAFVDILGFKNMVYNSQNDIQLQKSIVTAMNIIHSYKKMNDEGFDGGLKSLGIHITTFSDCAIISYPTSYDGGLFFVLLDIIHMQLELLKIGIFIRGGVSIGYAHHDEYNAFGPAVNDAYLLESTVARYPRVVLLRETIERGIYYSPSHQNDYDINLLYSLVNEDSNDLFYLDCLKQYQELDVPEADYLLLLKYIRSNLIQNLNFYFMNERKVYDKYLWFLNYWNYTLDSKHLTFPIAEGMDTISIKMLHDEYLKMRISTVYPHM